MSGSRLNVSTPLTMSVLRTYSGQKDHEECPIVKECGSPVCKVVVKSYQQRVGILYSNLLTHLRDHHTDKYTFFEACSKVTKKACLTKGKVFSILYVNYKSIV